jgi:cell division protein FtsB
MYSPLAMVILGVVLFFLARSAFNVYHAEERSRQELLSTQQEYKNLTEKSDFLTSEIEKLGSVEGLEEELRNKFRVVKEGEKMVIIVEPSTVASTSPDAGGKGFWANVVNFFR